jgi:signal transduction histidine kinase/ligand-binding sensor domain-containing protein
MFFAHCLSFLAIMQSLRAIVILFFLVVVSASAQGVYVPQIAFEHLTIDNGLPQNSVIAITQDKRGFMWFGTQDGLCRYDGYNVKLFRHDRTNPTSLRNSFTTSLLVDKSGTLWVGTAGGGLNKYNSINQSFTAYIHEPNNPQSLSDNNVQTLYQDRAGAMWIGTERGGINLFDTRTGRSRVFMQNPADEKSLPANRVSDITEDILGTLWIATLEGGLCYFNPADSTFVRIKFDATDPNATGGNLRYGVQSSPTTFAGSMNISALYADSKGILWVGTRGAGVVRVDVRNGTWTRFLPNASHSPILGFNEVFAIREDYAGRLWIALEGGGVCLYDRTKGTTTRYTHNPLNPRSISDNVIRGIFCDNAGTVWVGTVTGGVNKYAPNAHRFATYHHEPLNPRSLASNTVRAFCEDPYGGIWVGAVDGGLDRFVRSDGTFEHHAYVPKNDTSLGNEDVWALAAAKDGTIWVGTQNGLFAYHPMRGTRKAFRHNPQNRRSLSSNTIRALHIDRDGILWVGTSLGGMCKYDAASESFTTYRFPPTDSTMATTDGIVSDHVRDIFHGSDGTLWVGTANIGLLAFDKERGTVKATYHHNEAVNPGEGGLSNNTIRFLHEDKRGNIWVGTLDGLNCVSPQTGAIRVVTELDGLPNEVVYGILEDGSGYLWLTTNKGLVRFHPDKGTFKSYTKQDGLQSNEFNGHAVLHGSDGWFYVGGIGGFSTFHPDSIRDNGRIPPVILTDCKVFGKSLALDTVVTERMALTMPYTNNNYTFEFVSLNYVGTEKNRYRYILEPFDKDWVDAGERREAIYTNVEPGEYTFRVQGSNNDGIWNAEGATLQLVITPPWWGTWYFRLGAVVVVICLVYITYQARVYALRETARRLERLVQQRTQVLTETNVRLGEANEEVQRQMLQQHEQAMEIQKAYSQLDAANEILITRNYELHLLNKDKNDLLGIVSHDLRNPIVSTLLAIKLLQKRFHTLTDEEKFSYLDKIQSAGEQMIDFITKLLDVNALENGKMPISLVPCKIGVLTEAILENYQARAAAKNITLHYEQYISPHKSNEQEKTAQALVFADAVLLPQVLDNLISNALKYSPHGKNVFVRITKTEVQTVNDDDEGVRVSSYIRFAVQDEGPGLSALDKEKLFQKFTRLSARPTGGEYTTGLGLSIVKKMVEAMHGRVWCESEFGKGATFIVELPMNPAAAA